ncbi:uncharacterized protein LACBIDRAFT_313005 [Laccaria bicolor S238N-H82]|uniref:Predicted protein n=1 Tax=Laccaria bicolor (strain S238N-H82 / ATCC MYA-4686) TaxID=486041 RepID=B0DXB9_LACBS|nr:uncharacterized protein LACBIDRAFT_313005 [Laccaria bicolor S238N-H82]EDR00810.1 predicted protein [Laccaria bicolor S238N-H82]|eukprot:XP_001888602.1 predicted protein [Laccaria bicolor S238N-H82]
MTQLRAGHIPLNFYLHRIKKSPTRCCESCWGIARSEVTETVVHFLFECQVYTAERYDMDRALGRWSRDLQGIMESLERVKELLKYVGRTERFKKTLGGTLGDVSHLDSEEA